MSYNYKQYRLMPGDTLSDTPFAQPIEGKFKQIGIQSIPGLKFNFGNDSIILGYTGILNIDLIGTEIAINKIEFPLSELTQKIIGDNSKYLILDLISENEGG